MVVFELITTAFILGGSDLMLLSYEYEYPDTTADREQYKKLT